MAVLSGDRSGLGAGVALLLLGACAEEPPPVEQPEDLTRAPVAPEGCALSQRELACADGVGELMPELGVGGEGGAQPVGDAHCILRRAAELSCPSLVTRLAVGRGSAGELDVVVGQKGLDGREQTGTTFADDRLHFGTLRLALGDSTAAARAFDPISGGERILLGIVSGNGDGDSLLAVHRTTQHASPELTFSEAFSDGSTELTLPAAMQGSPPSSAAGPLGERAYLELTGAGAELVEGLPTSPRRVSFAAALALAVDYDDIGQPYVLSHQDSELRLFGGPDHDDLLWSEARRTSTDAEVDLLVGGDGVSERRYVLVMDGQTSGPELLVQEGSEPAARATLARGARGCDGWTLNVDCSECPVGTACENSDFITRAARLFAFGDRVFVAVHWIEHVDSRVTDTDTSLLGICVCDSTLVESANVAEYLSVYEVGYRGPDASLELSAVLDQMVGDGDSVGAYGLARGADDDLLFWYGPDFSRYDSNVGAFPKGGRRYVIEQLGGQP